MPRLVVRTPEGIALEREIAGAGSRFAAGLIDAVFLGLGYLALVLGFVLLSSADPFGSQFVLGILLGGVTVLLALYHFLFHVLWSGRTPGKHLLGLQVSSADGYPASVIQNLLRSALWPVDVLLPLPLPFGILGLVCIAVTTRRQRLGDLVAGTLVLRQVQARARPEPFPGERWSALPARTCPLGPGALARLERDDAELLRELLTRELPPEVRRRLYVASARHYAERLELGPFEDARVVLKELYLFLREARGRAD